MMHPRFTKFHGYGNDYIVFEADQLADMDDLGEFARRICDRHYGAGADGIAIAQRSEEDSSDLKRKDPAPERSSK